MFDHFTDAIERKATEAAQTAAFGLGAFLCLVVGGVFLTIAGWLFLLTITTALIASLIIGSTFFGIGLIIFAGLSMRAQARKRQKREAALRAQSEQNSQLSGGLGGIAGVIAAFITGMNAGKKSRF